MADAGPANLREEIRACIREELGRAPQQSLLNRTRSLISQSAYSASREATIAGSFNSGSSQSSGGGGSSSAKRPALKPVVGHPLRFKKQKVKPLAKVLPKSVYLLDEDGLEEEEEYTLNESMILLKGECDLRQDDSEDNVRSELVSLFRTKYPLITNRDFDFVKRDRNVISKPVVKVGHTWDFQHVKHLCGTGRLYARLNIAKETLVSAENEEANREDASGDTMVNMTAPCSSTTSDSTVPVINLGNVDNEERDLGSSATGSSTASTLQIENLQAVFPAIPTEYIRTAVLECGGVNGAVNRLLQYSTISTTQERPSNNEEQKFKTVAEIMQFLRSREMAERGMRERIKVDPGDEGLDLYTFYKTPDFDPKYHLSISLKGQPAIDTGGVLRQVFSNVFASLANNEVIPNVFVGQVNQRVPAYRSEIVMNGFFEVLGKMISHSLVQGGPGFPYLSPVIYSYLSTGDLHAAIGKASVSDVDDPDLISYFEKLNDAGDDELQAITFESDFIRLMAEAGEIRVVTAGNKLDVLQSLMAHNVLVRKKAVLDQLRKGLSILGVLAQIEQHPDLFEECFVHQGAITPEGVIASVRFSPAQGSEEQRVYQMFLNFIQKSDADELEAFLKFVTGCSSMSKSTLPRQINVSCCKSDSIFVSTCILQLKLPVHFSSQKEFTDAMKSVVAGTKFTTG